MQMSHFCICQEFNSGINSNLKRLTRKKSLSARVYRIFLKAPIGLQRAADSQDPDFGQKAEGLGREKDVGGVAFMLHGSMCSGVVSDDLLVRVGAERNDESLALPNSRPRDFTGKPMKGFVYVNSKAWSEDAVLKRWVGMGMDCVSSLPRK